MSYINISHKARQALKAIDESELESRIDKCLYEKQSHYLLGLRLPDCGPYVVQQLFDFEKAVTALRAASPKKRVEAKYSATKAGSNLAYAVSKMKEQVSIIEFDELTFAVEMPNVPTMALSECLSVRVGYSWRTDQNASWKFGHITFSYLAKEEPDYFPVVPARKVSKARQLLEEQDRLYRTWQHLSATCVESVYKYRKEGRDISLIPKTFTIENLNNFGAHFWDRSGA